MTFLEITPNINKRIGITIFRYYGKYCLMDIFLPVSPQFITDGPAIALHLTTHQPWLEQYFDTYPELRNNRTLYRVLTPEPR